jgi:hypothetical protein
MEYPKRNFSTPSKRWSGGITIERKIFWGYCGIDVGFDRVFGRCDTMTIN